MPIADTYTFSYCSYSNTSLRIAHTSVPGVMTATNGEQILQMNSCKFALFTDVSCYALLLYIVQCIQSILVLSYCNKISIIIK